MPVDKGPGDPVFTGTLNQFGVIEVRAEKVGARDDVRPGASAWSAEAQRPQGRRCERTADRLARYFLPAVEIVAGLTLLAGYLLGWPDVWSRTVAVLVVACPCALVLATPAAMLASMAWLARHGVLIKGGTALERLAACDTFAFDKTGHPDPRPARARALACRAVAGARGRGAPAGRRRRAGEPAPAGRAVVAEAGGRGLGRRPRSSRSRRCPARASRPLARARRRTGMRSSSATAGSWPSTASTLDEADARPRWPRSTSGARRRWWSPRRRGRRRDRASATRSGPRRTTSSTT